MAKNKRRKRAKKSYTGQNRHHLLYQARYWNNGQAKVLRNAFVYMLDVKIHDELHNAVLHNIPKPSSEAVSSIFRAFQAEECEITHLTILEAAEWLQNACDEEPFNTAMRIQADFLRKRLG